MRGGPAVDGARPQRFAGRVADRGRAAARSSTGREISSVRAGGEDLRAAAHLERRRVREDLAREATRARTPGTSMGARSVVTGERRPSGVAATAVKRSAPLARPPWGMSVSLSKGTLKSSGTSHSLPSFFGVPMFREACSGLSIFGKWTPESTASATFWSGVLSTMLRRDTTRTPGRFTLTRIGPRRCRASTSSSRSRASSRTSTPARGSRARARGCSARRSRRRPSRSRASWSADFASREARLFGVTLSPVPPNSAESKGSPVRPAASTMNSETPAPFDALAKRWKDADAVEVLPRHVVQVRAVRNDASPPGKGGRSPRGSSPRDRGREPR